MSGIRTLVVDDDFAVARVHAVFLERVPGFAHAGTALTAADALARVRAGGVDLLLLDLLLPDATGIEVLRRLRAGTGAGAGAGSDAGSGIDVIVVSAARDPALVERAAAFGAADFLLKPFSQEEFRARLAAYAARARERRLLRGLGGLSQLQVDAVLRRGGPARAGAAPKPLNATTRQRVLEALGALGARGAAATAVEVAAATGLSRVSARRYLERLAHEGVVEVRPRYGEPGRPRHEYLARC